MEMSPADWLKESIHLVEEKHHNKDISRGFMLIFGYSSSALQITYHYRINVYTTSLRLMLHLSPPSTFIESH